MVVYIGDGWLLIGVDWCWLVLIELLFVYMWLWREATLKWLLNKIKNNMK